MSVRLINSIYYYEFMYRGKRYRGTCVDQKTGESVTVKKDALKYENFVKEQIKNLRAQNNVQKLVQNYRDELAGGTKISLADAFDASLEKPRKKMPGKDLQQFKRSVWCDFYAYMDENYPSVCSMSNVQRKHAEEYISYIRKNGRFGKVVSYNRKGAMRTKRTLKGKLSAKTINTFQQILTEVFQLLSHDAGIVENPFSAIPMLKKESETREAFTEAELKKIRENFDDFTRPLFTIAISTALREGDICTLKWNEIDFQKGVVMRQKMRKTGNTVEIPMMPQLRAFLIDIQEASKTREEDEYSCYVLPEHAKMYLNNRTGVSYRIKNFLEKCGIQTSKIPEGRTHAVSVKDLHSCRHTFCYLAGMSGIPLVVVQSIVGHMTSEMTKHYSAHATIEDKREKMKLLPSFLSLTTENDVLQAKDVTPSPELKSIFNMLENVSPEKLITLKPLFEAILGADNKILAKLQKILDTAPSK